MTDSTHRATPADAGTGAAGAAPGSASARRDETHAGRAGHGDRCVPVSDLMRECLARISRVAPTDAPILIRGETGTGKEELARLAHETSLRSSGPFEVVRFGTIPEVLAESELFGHEQGAFPGATRRRAGKLELALGGSLFLDEIGDAPESVQVKLLRVLCERHATRVGGTAQVPVDVRVIAASSLHLERLMAEGRFRADLLSRLAASTVSIPPLRQRPEDILPLAHQLLRQHARRLHRPPPTLPRAAASALLNYDWPGNTRELEHLLERALILSPGAELQLPGALGDFAVHADALSELPPRGRFDDMVRDLLRRALEATQGRIYGPGGAAAMLDLRPTTLQSKLKKYGLRREDFSVVREAYPDAPASSDDEAPRWPRRPPAS